LLNWNNLQFCKSEPQLPGIEFLAEGEILTTVIEAAKY